MAKIYGFSQKLKSDIASNQPPFIGDLGIKNPPRGTGFELPAPYVLRVKSEHGLDDIPCNGFLTLAPGGSFPAKFFKGFLKKEAIPMEMIYYRKGGYKTSSLYSKSRPVNAGKNEFVMDFRMEFGFENLDVEAAIDASKGVNDDGVLVGILDVWRIQMNATVNAVNLTRKKFPNLISATPNAKGGFTFTVNATGADRAPNSAFMKELNTNLSIWLHLNCPDSKTGFKGMYVKAVG